MASNIHITKANEGWQGKRAGSNRASFKVETQAEAIRLGTKIAKNDEVEIFIHGRDGKIRERNTFSKDPFPPRG